MKTELFKNTEEELIPDNQSLFNDNLLKEIDKSFHLLEKEDKYIAEIEAKGIKKEEFKIHVHENVLYIRGEHKHEARKNEKGCYDEKSVYSEFNNAFILPPDADQENIRSRSENGKFIVEIIKKKSFSGKAPVGYLEEGNKDIGQKPDNSFWEKVKDFFK
jgi:HSP20 family molecular chaperone IbpA